MLTLPTVFAWVLVGFYSYVATRSIWGPTLVSIAFSTPVLYAFATRRSLTTYRRDTWNLTRERDQARSEIESYRSAINVETADLSGQFATGVANRT